MSDPARGPGNGPTIHGVYGFWLGGGQHTRADRERGREIRRRFPTVPGQVRAAQEFHLRVARWAARRGVARFVQTGPMAALPPGRNVHDAARSVIPSAEVIYASREPVASEWARALLRAGGTQAIRTGDENSILDEEPVKAMLADGEPVCVIAGLTAHFLSGDVVAARVARMAEGLPTGSLLAVSVAVPDGSPQAAELAAMFAPARLHRHTPDDITGWLRGAGLRIAPPGVTDVRAVPGRRRWAPWCMPAGPPGFIAGGVAVRP